MSSVQQALKYDPILRRMIISDVESHGDAVEIGYTHIFNKPGTTIGYAKGLYVKRYEGITRLVESLIGYENETSASSHYLPFIVPTDILGSSISIDLDFSDTTSGLSIFSLMTASGPTLQFSVNNFAGSLINYDPVTHTNTTDIPTIFSGGLTTFRKNGKDIFEISGDYTDNEATSSAWFSVKSGNKIFGSYTGCSFFFENYVALSIDAAIIDTGTLENPKLDYELQFWVKGYNALMFAYESAANAVFSPIPWNFNAGIKASSIGCSLESRGSITQLTSKSTAVTLNKAHGQITTTNDAMSAGSSVTFTLNNSEISLGDFVFPDIQSGATDGAYEVKSKNCAAGSCQIVLKNVSGGALSEAVVIKFFVFKSPIPA